jgi:hypothetical protein
VSDLIRCVPSSSQTCLSYGWIQGRHHSLAKLDLRVGRSWQTELVISVVNLAEVLLHTTELVRATGADAVALLTASRVRIISLTRRSRGALPSCRRRPPMDLLPPHPAAAL